ncbi:MAG TPA: type 2 isopentenyl-diphosphate Delta-isomerase [Blastocatellia bacterium]|nr:type 2 isopentenyl-diphosphate Delta-isomerase [Blastocatellia bacterium]
MAFSTEINAESADAIAERKRSHFELCAHQAVEFRHKTTWFEDVELVHQPLTETALDDIDLSVEVMGRRLKYPVIITGMSGGTEETGRFNREMAALAERMGIGFGVGSQRVMLRQPQIRETFQVRDVAPNVLLFGNIGIAQARELGSCELTGLMQDIQADALCLHLNTAMEIIQENGDHDFRGSLSAVARAVDALGAARVVVKETGCGFARETGARLAAAGVEWVDVSGAGGTSWVGVETLRNRALRHLGEAFWDWGIPTAASVCELRGLSLSLIASGGIRNGLQAAKALALGARLTGIALPVMRAWVQGGIDGAEAFLRAFCAELRVALMLCGCARLDDLTPQCAVISGRLLDWITQRRLPVAGLR